MPQAGGPKAEVRTLQESLNRWRVVKGDTPIKEDGLLSPDTKNAIKEFQRASGLKPQDGIAGPATLDRLKVLLDILKNIPNSPVVTIDRLRLVGLVGSLGFGSLSPAMQNEVLARILSYQKAGANSNIPPLSNLVSQPGFELLRASIQKLMLNILAARPDDAGLADNFAQLASSQGFRFEEPMQIWVLNRIKAYGGNRVKIGNLRDLITTTIRFDLLSKESRSLMLVALANHPREALLVNIFSRATDRPDFRSLDQVTQTEVLTRILNYPRTFLNVDNLMSLMTLPLFRNLAFGVRAQVLDSLPTRFQNVTLDPTMIGNLMTVLTTVGFEKLRPVQDLLLEVQAERPSHTQLAANLSNIVGHPGLRKDQRTAAQIISQVRDSTP